MMDDAAEAAELGVSVRTVQTRRTWYARQGTRVVAPSTWRGGLRLCRERWEGQ